MKKLYIAEKPSVAQEFAKALKIRAARKDGYLEGEEAVVTWCVGHLVTMSYPEVYDASYKKWSLATLPFLPENFLYEVIPATKKQFKVVSTLLNRKDIDVIYVCTDSGREGEYIYRLVEQEAHVQGKKRLRVWIDSQTEEEILHGIATAKDLSAYDNLASAAYLRAKEDYLMGINFSRLLSLKYGQSISSCMGTRYTVISVGRVMTCVLGMIVRREREIRQFVKMPFYRVLSSMVCGESTIEGEFRAVKGSAYFQSPKLYKENGFSHKEDAKELIEKLSDPKPVQAVIEKLERKKENKNPPLLYNLAELQNDCSKRYKISPDETLKIVQELYEKKLVTYPRTDARVLSTAVAKEIHKNIRGLSGFANVQSYAAEVLEGTAWKKIASTRYVNDKQITDHYAIIPTGQGLLALRSVSALSVKVYELIVRRFLSIFYPPAIYQKTTLVSKVQQESFFSSFRLLLSEGYLKVAGMPEENKKKETELRDHLIHRVMTEIPYVRLNGHPSQRLSNNANFSFQFIEGESLLIMLDMAGICGSSGSACTSGSLDPSHVLLAIGLPHEIAHGSLRLTLGEETTMEDIDYTVDQLKRIVERLRSMSPLYEDFVKSREKKENQ